MEIKEQLNEEKQKAFVEELLRSGYNLVKENLGKKSFFKTDDSYSLEKLLNNIRNNNFPLLYRSLYYLLKEDFVDKDNLFTNLLKYKFHCEKKETGITDFNKYNIYDNNYDIHLSIHSKKFHIAHHEMHHFTTFFYRGDCVDAGLMHYDVEKENDEYKAKNMIGLGINEGVTDLLTNLEIFDGKPFKIVDGEVEGVGYPVSYQYAKCLGKIIGVDKLKEFYYSGNLFGLVDEMAKYTDKGSALAFIRKLDVLCEHLDKQDYYEYIDEFHNDDDRIEDCSNFLLKLSNNKYGKDVIGDDIVKIMDGECIVPGSNSVQYWPSQIKEAFKMTIESMNK